ncbi:MAG: type IV-A pilus assembly ATPase PilB [Sandaracinaceae bacterium]|nr:MAG: type II secretion system protein GspE [Sandaracinaceae bacterium]
MASSDDSARGGHRLSPFGGAPARRGPPPPPGKASPAAVKPPPTPPKGPALPVPDLDDAPKSGVRIPHPKPDPLAAAYKPAPPPLPNKPANDAPPPAPKAEATPEPAPEEPAPRRKLRLGELLVQAGVVSDEDVGRALAVQKMGGGRLGSILVSLKLCTEDQIRFALEHQMGVEVVELQGLIPDEAVLHLLPRELVRKYEAVPIRKEGDTVYVAMIDPYNLTALDDIRFCSGARKLVVVTCTESDFRSFVEEHLETQSLMEEILSGDVFFETAIKSVRAEDEPTEDQEPEEIVHDLRLAGEQPPIITLCNFLLVESITRGASDIHVEPYETYFRVRLRIDGRLQTLLTPPQRLHNPMITRFKVMAEMDISKRRIPQDGHIAIVYNGETCHYRVSTLPTVYGEKCVIRLLKKNKELTSLDSIGFEEDELKLIKRLLHLPQGIVLVTGPTGSGKTTTLHAGLSHINDPEVNIVTLEDPVEASLAGINHVQTSLKGGVTFASGLRSILRQDPDVVFVGEMRDPEVSKIAVKAALTGHLVLSTLHTNSAVESLVRLADMGVPPYLVANALQMVLAQRLVRRVCERCAKPHAVTEEEIEEFRLTPEQLEGASLKSGSGCAACYETGYRGRVAVYEILRCTHDMRDLIREEAPMRALIAQSKKDGMRTLWESGIVRALRGETTLEEVRRVLADAG